MQDKIDRKYCICPLIKEMCVNGHTKSMGSDEKTGEAYVCRWWTHIVGKDPQSEKQIDWFDCAIAWLPTIGIEQSQMIRQNSSGLDKTANVIFEALNPKTQQKILQGSEVKLIEGGN